MMGKRRRLSEEVDPSPAQTDSSDDLVSRDGISVYFYAQVNRGTVHKLFVALREAAAAAAGGEVYLYVHSEGGDVYAGLSAYDHLRAFRGARVVTVADGFVASAASLILLGGERRYVMPHAHVLIHQLSTGFWGKYSDLRDEMSNSTAVMQLLRAVYAARTRMKSHKIDALLEKDVVIDATRCVKLGIADEIERGW